MAVPFASSIDLGTAVILGGVLLMEGVRRVPPGALVLRAIAGGRFEPVPVPPGVRLVSLLPPITASLVLEPGAPAPPDTPGDLSTRLTAARTVLGPVRLLSAVILAGVLLGIPIALALAGAGATLVAIGVLLLLAVEMAILVSAGLQAMGWSRSAARRRAAGMLSPFGATHGVEVLLQAAVRGEPPARVARHLLADEAFERWLRPRLYDASRPGAAPVPELAAIIPPDAWLAWLELRPAGIPEDSAAWCPRCAATYRAEADSCADCQVRLSRANSAPEARHSASGGASALR